MWVNYNGLFFPENALPVSALDPALCYGVSLFETMRWTGDSVPLLALHWRRLQAGIKLLGMPLPSFWSEDFLLKEIQNTVKRNRIEGAARVRLQVMPDWDESKPDSNSGIRHIILCLPCEPLVFNPLGVHIGIATPAIQPLPPPFCAFKTGNYLPYFLAIQAARARGLDDMLLLNRWGRIGEAATANVFWAQDGTLYTPPLSEEIVAGVGRSHLIEVLSHNHIPVTETPFTKTALKKADAVFLTNAFRGVRPVASCEGTKFENGMAEFFFKKAFSVMT